MKIFRRGEAQLPLEIELPGRGGEQIPAPDHLSHTHKPVIRCHGKLIGVHSVRAAEDKIPAVPAEIHAVFSIYSV